MNNTPKCMHQRQGICIICQQQEAIRQKVSGQLNRIQQGHYQLTQNEKCNCKNMVTQGIIPGLATCAKCCPIKAAEVGANNPHLKHPAPWQLSPPQLAQFEAKKHQEVLDKLEKLNEQLTALARATDNSLRITQEEQVYLRERLDKMNHSKIGVHSFRGLEESVEERLDALEKSDEAQDEFFGRIEDLIEFDVKRRLRNLEAKSEFSSVWFPVGKEWKAPTQTPKSDIQDTGVGTIVKATSAKEAYEKLAKLQKFLKVGILTEEDCLQESKEFNEFAKEIIAEHKKTKSEPTYCCEKMKDSVEFGEVVPDIFNGEDVLRVAGTGVNLYFCPFCGCEVSK